MVMVEMEGKPSPHLKKVLKSYQLNAANTMNGPGIVLSRQENGRVTSNNSAFVTNHQFIRSPKYNFIDGGGGGGERKDSRMVWKRVAIKQEVGGGPVQMLKNPVLYKAFGNQNSTHSQSLISEDDLIKQKKDNLDGVLNLRPVIETPSTPTTASSGGRRFVKSILPPPILSTSDRSRSEKRETILEGEYISYFAVGGEKRLCFPQILTSVLRGFTLQQINQVCDELQIFCSQCLPEQLEVLKVTAIIPMSAPSCGLIKKTDAERLVNSLLHRDPPKAAVSFMAAATTLNNNNNRNGLLHESIKQKKIVHFRVYHECFGKCKGVIFPHLYEKPDALCIECVECRGVFSPQRFVSHSHRHENRTCHWGFDSSNWRRYLLVSKDESSIELLELALKELKSKYDLKRKESRVYDDGGGSSPEERVIIKKICYSPTEETHQPHSNSFSSNESFSNLPTKKRLPLIRYSNMDSPDLSKPENVESVKKMVLQGLGPDGADIVNGLIDSMSQKISSLAQKCRNQEKMLQERQVNGETKVNGAGHDGIELQAKVNTMEAELHSLKKQILRRHESREDSH